MGKRYLGSARGIIRLVRGKLKDPALKQYLSEAIDDIDTAEFLYGKQIQEAKMIGVRNPAFDGDMVGYPEDDIVDYYGLDEDEKKK
jgi:hypothetical protein